MANAIRRAGRRKGMPAGLRKRPQVLGEGVAAAFIFSSMHLLTRSARLSRFSWALPFSVRIQHSRAARVRVIGVASLTASGGREGWTVSGAASGSTETVAVGPVPLVWQAASARTQAERNATRVAKDRTLQITSFICAFRKYPGGAAAYLPEKTRLRNARGTSLHNRECGRKPPRRRTR